MTLSQLLWLGWVLCGGTAVQTTLWAGVPGREATGQQSLVQSTGLWEALLSFLGRAVSPGSGWVTQGIPGRACAPAVGSRWGHKCSKEQWQREENEEEEVVQGCRNVEGMEAWQLGRCWGLLTLSPIDPWPPKWLCPGPLPLAWLRWHPYPHSPGIHTAHGEWPERVVNSL